MKDVRGKITIARRIERVKKGNFGDHKQLDTSLWELRLPQGPGYRVYFTREEDRIVLLLIGGDKSSQNTDIAKAKKILKELQDENR